MPIKAYKKIFFILSVFTLFLFGSGDAFACTQDSECLSPAVCDLPSGLCLENPFVVGGTPVAVDFSAPTDNLRFSDFMCDATAVLAETILPPVAVLMTMVVGFLFLTSRGSADKVRLANKMLIFSLLGIAVVLTSPAIISIVAASINASGDVLASCGGSGAATDVITNAFVRLINWLSWFVALTAVAVGLYSGFLFFTSSGNAEQLNKAWKTFMFAIIGIAIAIFALSIVSIVRTFIV